MKSTGAVALPWLVVTATATEPAACAGVLALIWLEESEVIVPAVPPKVTELAPVRFVPVMVTSVPPVAGPEVGVRDVIVGLGLGVTELEGEEAGPVPSALVATTLKV